VLELAVEGVILGILSGGVYALMASGLTLTFGVMGVINIAQGAFVILGAYLSIGVVDIWRIDPLLTLFITMPVAFAIGVVSEVCFVRPLRHDRERMSVVVTYALGLLIEGVLGPIFLYGRRILAVPFATSSFRVLDFYVGYIYLIAFGLAIAILCLFFLFLYKTKTGVGVRAVSQNRLGAEVVGVETEKVAAITFGLSTAAAAAAGTLFGALFAFTPNSMFDLIARLLAIVVLGGLGSLPGAVIGAVVMLVGEDVVASMWSPSWAAFMFYAMLVVVLVLRPQGILGGQRARRV